MAPSGLPKFECVGLRRRQLLTLLATPALGHAQGSAEQATRIVLPFSAGSGPDHVSRLVAEQLALDLNRPVVVENRPGGNGFIALTRVKYAPPTGQELVVAASGHLTVNPSLFKSLPYDPKADFAPVALLYKTSFFVSVGANNKIRTFRDLVQAARAQPDRVSYASNGTGSPLHLGATHIESATFTRMVHVPYKEASLLYASVASGDVDWALATLGSVAPLVQAGKLRLVAIADRSRSALRPDVPTIREAGGPEGVDISAWVALLAPRGTPAAIVSRLQQGVANALARHDIKEKLSSMGFTALTGTTEQIAKLIEHDTTQYAALVRRIGIAPQ